MDPNSNATTRTVSKGRNGSWLAAVMTVPLVLAGCGGGSAAPPATIGGTVAGLRTANSVVLQDNTGDATSVSVNGSFAFATKVARGAAYAVTVLTQPTGQTCTVANGGGTVAAAAVSTVAVSCSNNTYSVGATVSGLVANTSLVLQDNGGDNLTVSADGTTGFNTPIASGSAYAVTVLTQASGQTCTVTNGSGTVTAANVTNVSVTCVALHFAYVGNYSDGTVSAYAIDPNTGALTAVAGGPFAVSGTGTLSIALTPNGKFAYVASRYSSPTATPCGSTLSAFSVNANTGALTPIAGSPFGSCPVSVTVDPTGKFAYATNLNTNTISAYTIDPTTGALTAVAGSPFATSTGPYFVAAAPNGKFLYVVNGIVAGGGYEISVYAIDAATGALTGIAGSPFSSGANYLSVTIDPLGKFAYFTAFSDNTVSAYSIDATTGAPAAIAGSPFATGTGPAILTLDPSGHFAYVANHTSNSVSIYSVDATTGALAPIAGSPVATGAGPFDVAIDPAGKFAYVTNYTDGTVSSYSRDGTTGALTSISGGTVPTGVRPFAIVIK